MATKTKKKRNTIGSPEPVTIELTYIPGAVIVQSPTEAKAALTELAELQAAIKPVTEYMEQLRLAGVDHMQTCGIDVIQLKDSYYRKVQRFSRFWIATDADIPVKAPKGTKSLKTICKNKRITVKGKEIPLWNFITKRVLDADKIQDAISLKALTEKEASKAYLEFPQRPFVQRFEGQPKDDDE